MLRSISLLAALTVAGVGHYASADATESRQERIPKQECETHKLISTDCHVHEKETYLHLKNQQPHTLPPHARAEYRELDHQYGRQGGR